MDAVVSPEQPKYKSTHMWVDCRFEQAEFVERELERMGEQIKETIQNINTAQVRKLLLMS